MTDYTNNTPALDVLLREDETPNMEYVHIAEVCVSHAVNIKYGMREGVLITFINAARDALRRVTGVSAPIADVISNCMLGEPEYIQEAIPVIKAFC